MSVEQKNKYPSGNSNIAKRIMFLIPTMSGGGAERIVAILSDRFIAEHDVEIFTFEKGTSFYDIHSDIKLRSAGIIVNRKNRRTTTISTLIQMPKVFVQFKKECLNYQPDVVISFLPQAAAIAHLARRGNLNYCHISSERNDPTKRSKLMQRFLKHIYGNVDSLVCQSKVVADYYSTSRKEQISIIPNPINLSLIPVATKERVPPRIVAVGRLQEQKNYPLLIKSFKCATSKIDPKTTLMIYGEGKLRSELKELVNSLNLEDKVRFQGLTKNIFDEIKDAALFVMSSDYEGFPNALLEAIAVGLPVISTDFYTGVSKELIKGENGIVVPVGNVPAMAEAIVQIMNNSSLRQEIRKNNRKKIKTYDINNIAKMWDKLVL